MSAPAFSPWTSEIRVTDGPDKCLDLGQAQSILSEAERVQGDPAAQVSRLLALRRWWGQSVELHPVEEPGHDAQGRRLAHEIAAAVHSHLAPAGLQGEAAEAINLELELLDQRSAGAPGEATRDAAGTEAKRDFPVEGPLLSGAYGAYVRGLWHAVHGHAEGAVESLGEALKLAAGDSEAERRITCELLPVLFAAQHDDRLLARAEGLVRALSMSGRHLFDLGWALHWLARAQERRGNWPSCVESARESNLRLFQFGASQKARIIGINYYLVARGMAELEEWGEGAALAQLSLRSLEFTPQYPGRADALLVLARCLQAFGEEKPTADARGVLSRLLDERPLVADADRFYEEVTRRRAELGAGPASRRPG